MMSSKFDPNKYFTQERPAETKDYIMQQTMVRVKDPEASLKFYCDVLGFNLIMYRELPQYEFNVYFVAQVDPSLSKSAGNAPRQRAIAVLMTPSSGCAHGD